jgi:hypothetical protein
MTTIADYQKRPVSERLERMRLWRVWQITSR